VLQKVKQKRVADPDCTKFLGVDDWAWRKAQRLRNDPGQLGNPSSD
jgi:hypothetical protein